MHFLFVPLVLLNLIKLAHCTCESYGIDFTNGGSYFIDDTDAIDFTFLTQFEGCDDEEITPILVDPDENEYFCSQIATSPDDTSFLSTCPILQTEMFSGSWYIVIEGLTFAYVRTFTLTVGAPTTVTATPTVTVGITSTPDAVTPTTVTATPTVTVGITSTPDATITITKTTKTISTSTTSTLTSTAICTPPYFPPGVDPKLQNPLYLPHTTIIPHSSKKAKPRHVRDVMYAKAKGMPFNVRRNAQIAKRGPDDPTVTVTETTSSATITTTSTLPASTIVLTTYTTSISTSTPPAITKCAGVTKVTYTTTAPTMTFTRLSVKQTTVFVTKTVSICHTIKTTTTPKAEYTSCVNSGGWM
ncbi:uncharacterized protein PAC_04763 [Phialocephala subalpina]|uniref:Uncharacterized protein n=1 Tax=Phialocephala subalpina TaxID=576137 RepID=A0A1L7WQ33_9HELO|nr:uncharacterized protein PAC_04763 [Phialocephala subalpina]